MDKVTLELTEGELMKIILSLKFSAEAVNWDSSYTKQISNLATKIEEIAKAVK
jgi:hypothetical protein